MKPAISVILLTTLIGAGQGLFLAYYSTEVFSLLTLLPASANDQSITAAALSLLLMFFGLIASFFHLGHPERAWRAAAMWRSSWLSREVISLPCVMMLVSVYLLLKYVGDHTGVFVLNNANAIELSVVVGFIAMLAILILFVCTAMIYACLKFLRQWHSPLTVANFFLMGFASGFTLAALISVLSQDGYFDYFVANAIWLTLAALLMRLLTMRRNSQLRSPSTLQSAIGIHHPNIRQMAQGAMGGSFNTRAFIHNYGASVVRLARRYFIVAGFLLPLTLLVFSDDTSVFLCAIAFIAQMTGLMVERWYFFIEADHPQNIYYQMIS
jgi:DMSO reductase anchor subunit